MGSGYRVFTAGEVLTASNVQNYLQNQSVMSFADSTARATSIGTANFEEGMVSYLQDSDTLEVYDGSTWGSIAPATTQGLTLINTTSFSAVASQSINDVFSSTYDQYKIVVDAKASTDSAMNLRLRVSGSDNSSSNYYWSSIYNSSTTDTVSGNKSSGLTTSFNILDTGTFDGGSTASFELYNPFKTARTGFIGTNTYVPVANTFSYTVIRGGATSVTTSYTGFTLLIASGTMTGNVSVYGFNK